MKEEEKPPDTDADKMLGVAEFEEQYFCGPLYLSDEDRTLYQHLGNQPIFTLGTLARALLNPFKARREMKEMGERMKARKIEGNMVGDGLVKGGACWTPACLEGGEMGWGRGTDSEVIARPSGTPSRSSSAA